MRVCARAPVALVWCVSPVDLRLTCLCACAKLRRAASTEGDSNASLPFPCQIRRASNSVDLRFFRSIPFSSATLLALCAFASFAGFLFLNALYLQQARGFSAFHTGLCTLPLAILMMVSAPLSGRLVGRHGTRPSLLAAGVAFLLSTLMLMSAILALGQTEDKGNGADKQAAQPKDPSKNFTNSLGMKFDERVLRLVMDFGVRMICLKGDDLFSGLEHFNPRK